MGLVLTALTFIVQQASANLGRYTEEQRKLREESEKFVEGLRLDMQKTEEAINSASFQEVSDRISELSARQGQLAENILIMQGRFKDLDQEIANNNELWAANRIETELALSNIETAEIDENNGSQELQQINLKQIERILKMQ